MNNPEREATFRRWFEQHLGLMLKVVRGGTATPQDEDDLLQDILLQLWSSIPSFRQEAKETTWIYRVAYNTAMAWRLGLPAESSRSDEDPAAAPGGIGGPPCQSGLKLRFARRTEETLLQREKSEKNRTETTCHRPLSISAVNLCSPPREMSLP